MGNSITATKDKGLEVVFEPGFVIRQPACLPGEDGQPKLTGYTVGTLLVQLAKQIVAAKAPDMFDRTNVPSIMTEVTCLSGKFIVRFTDMAALGLIPAGQPLMDELGHRAMKNAAVTDAAE